MSLLNYSPQSGLSIYFYKFYKAITLVSFLAIVGGGYLFLVKPYYRIAVAQKKLELTATEEALVKQKKYLTELQKIKDSYESLGDEGLTKLNLALPFKRDLPNLLVELEAISLKNNLAITSLNINKETAGESEKETMNDVVAGLGKLNITLNLSPLTAVVSNYQGIKGVLGDFEQSLRIINVKAINFSAANQQGYVINLETYYIDE